MPCWRKDPYRKAHAIPSTDITLVGGPTVLFTYAGLTVLTDPTFDAPGEFPVAGTPLVMTKTDGPGVALEDLPDIDLVLLSHDEHEDNLDNSGRELAQGVEHVVSTAEAGQREDWIQGLEAWQETTLTAPDGSAVHITAVPALHGPEGCEPVSGTVTGFVLHADGLPNVYVSGDNASPALAGQVAERFPETSLAILFAGGVRHGEQMLDNQPLTMTSEDTARVAGLFPQAQVVPAHIDGWAHSREHADQLQAAFEAAGVADRLHLLAPGESTTLELA